MISASSVGRIIVLLIIADVTMRSVVTLYYSDHRHILRIVNLVGGVGRRPAYYHRFDPVLAPLPFLWAWLEITLWVLLARWFNVAAIWCVAIVGIGGRFRALQEFGHNAVHFALCRSRSWQWLLADFFYQFPAFKRDMHSREITHTKEHHRNPNHDSRDPNRARVAAGGMKGAISRGGFWRALLFPLTPVGFVANCTVMYRNTMLNFNWATLAVRLSSIMCFGWVFYTLAGWRGILLGWCVPLLTTYPLFAWIALLTEHRWFVEERPGGRRENEMWVGRPTDYPGVSGLIVRMLISPTSDAYHLAHSLYPGVRWNYLPTIDRFLKINDARYTAHASQGLLVSKVSIPSALSELRERLCVKLPTSSQDSTRQYTV